MEVWNVLEIAYKKIKIHQQKNLQLNFLSQQHNASNKIYFHNNLKKKKKIKQHITERLQFSFALKTVMVLRHWKTFTCL